MQKPVVIVGAGITGITAARILADRNIEVLLLEENNQIGGACQDFRDATGVNVHRFGPHIFRTNRKDIMDFLSHFSPFYMYQHKVLSYIDGQYMPFPINLNTLQILYGDSASENAKVLAQRCSSFTAASNFEDAMVKKVGKELYELFYKGYSRKQWLIEPDQLLPEVAAIIPIRKNRDDRYFTDTYQGVPIPGYTEMFQAMLDHPRIHIMLNTNYFDIGAELTDFSTIYTGRIDRLMDYKYGELEYHSVKFEYRRGERKEKLPSPVVNYPNDFDYIRETEYNAFTPYECPYTIIGREYPQKQGYPFYSIPTEANYALHKRYLMDVQEKLPNFILVGRIALYKNQNIAQCIAAVIDALSGFC